MPARGLVIAIEEYPKSVDLASRIAGATASGERFFAWLTTVKGVRPEDVYVAVSGGTFTGATRFSTGREAVVDAMAALVAAGQDQTEELYVFFSGHGYCFQESLEKRAIDVLVAGDFESAARSGTRCIKLQEVQEKLYAILGGAHHYYFIDACRTLIHDDEIEPIALGRKLGRPAQRGRPTKYTLYSTAYGAPAAIVSDFAPALLDGLHGKGSAKGFSPAGGLYVMFPRLCIYVEGRVRTQKVDQNKDGNGEGYILGIAPVPFYTCAIQVDGASATDAFEARLAVAGNPALASVTPFTGPNVALSFNPGGLVLEVRDKSGQALARIDPSADAVLEFFDDCGAVFRKTDPLRGLPQAAPPRAAMVRMARVPHEVHTEATNLQTGDVTQILAGQDTELAPGDYQVTLHERGVPISRKLATFAPGSSTNLGDEPLGPVRESIIRAVHGDPSMGVVAFSETLGPMASRDLGLWLTLMGAAHILQDPTTFSKLRDLPLARVGALPPDSTAVYLLSAVAEGDAAPTLDVGGRMRSTEPVAPLTGVFQAMAPATPGFQLVTIGFGTGDTRTLASCCLPNRVTFVVCAPGARGQLRVHQFLLPMFHLRDHLPPGVEDFVRNHPRPLRVIRTAYLFQSKFARARAIDPPDNDDRIMWSELLSGKWIDPVMSLLACYEILRRGDDNNRAMVRQTVVPNLDQYFPGVPDTAAVAALLGLDRPMPAAPPLFREGLLAFPEWEDHLPLAADRLDFNYTWTMWRGRRS